MQNVSEFWKDSVCLAENLLTQTLLSVPINPLRHQPLVAEAFFRDGAALDPGEALGEGHLL